MITRADTYSHPANGERGMTEATLADGRKVTINTQYGVVQPHGSHADTCDQLTKIGGRCNCGLLDGIDVEALVADARERGKIGPAPRRQPEPVHVPAASPCPRCGTYCYGDCTAN